MHNTTTGVTSIVTSANTLSTISLTGNVSGAGAFGIGGQGSSGAWHGTTTAATSASTGRSRVSFGGGNSVIALYGDDGEEIVKLRGDGIVVWKSGTQVDEATKAFSLALRQGAAMTGGITAVVKAEIRNEIYANLIALAKEKGNLSIEDLTFDRDSCILVEKLANPTKE